MRQHLSNLTDTEHFQELKNRVIRKLSVGDLERKRKDCKYKLYHTRSVVASKKVTAVGTKLIQEHFRFSAETVFEVAFLSNL